MREMEGSKDTNPIVLSRKVSKLQSEKNDLLCELEICEKNSEKIRREAKVEAAHLHQLLGDSKKEHSRSLQHIKDHEQFSLSEKELSINCLEDKVRYYINVVQTLEGQMMTKDAELGALRDENKDFRERLERLYRERGSWQDEISIQTRLQKDMSSELEESQKLLTQSEIERVELRNQYVNVGEKFKQLLDVEEKENSEAVRQMMEKLKQQKERCERYRKKGENLASDVCAAKEETKDALAVVQEKETELERLNLLLRQESDSVVNMEERNRKLKNEIEEMQKRSAAENKSYLDKFKEMIPMESHQSILQDMQRQQNARVQELQTKMKLLQNSSKEEKQKQKEESETVIGHARNNLSAMEKQMEDLRAKSRNSEQEIGRLKQQLTNRSQSLKEAEEAKRNLSEQLEGGQENLTKLRQLLDEQRATSEETTSEKDSELQEARATNVSMKKELEEQAKWAAEFEATYCGQLQTSDEELEKLMEKCRELDATKDIQTERIEDLTNSFDAVELEKQNVAQRLMLEQHHAQRAFEFLARLAKLVFGQLRKLRKEHQMIKDHMKSEFDHLMSSICHPSVLEKWSRLCSNHERIQQNKIELRTRLEETVRLNGALSMECNSSQSEIKSLEIRLNQITKDRDSLKFHNESQEEIAQLLITTMERMMMSVGGQGHLQAAMGSSNFSEVLHSARRSFNDAVAARLEREKEDARAAERELWEKKYQALKYDFTASQIEQEEELSKVHSILSAPMISPRGAEDALQRSSLLGQQARTLNERMQLHLETSS